MNPIETLRNKIYDSIGSLSDVIHRDFYEHRIGSIMESLSSILEDTSIYQMAGGEYEDLMDPLLELTEDLSIYQKEASFDRDFVSFYEAIAGGMQEKLKEYRELELITESSFEECQRGLMEGIYHATKKELHSKISQFCIPIEEEKEVVDEEQFETIMDQFVEEVSHFEGDKDSTYITGYPFLLNHIFEESFMNGTIDRDTVNFLESLVLDQFYSDKSVLLESVKDVIGPIQLLVHRNDPENLYFMEESNQSGKKFYLNKKRTQEYDNNLRNVLGFYSKSYPEVVPISKMKKKRTKDTMKNIITDTYSLHGEMMFVITLNHVDERQVTALWFDQTNSKIKDHDMYYIASICSLLHCFNEKVSTWAKKIVKQEKLMDTNSREKAKSTSKKFKIKGRSVVQESLEMDYQKDNVIEESEEYDFYEENGMTYGDYLNFEKPEWSRILTDESEFLYNEIKEIQESMEEASSFTSDSLLYVYLEEYYENPYSLDHGDILNYLDSHHEELFEEAKESEKKIDDDIAGIIILLNDKGYKTKYSCSGHSTTRFKNDQKRDGVMNNKLYSTARVIFSYPYKFDELPKGWEEKLMNKGIGIYVTPKTYSEKNGNPKEAFEKWKREYLANLKGWVQTLPKTSEKKKEKEDNTYTRGFRKMRLKI